MKGRMDRDGSCFVGDDSVLRRSDADHRAQQEAAARRWLERTGNEDLIPMLGLTEEQTA